jgi:transaldolase/glucose-6-phosphate isomerase
VNPLLELSRAGQSVWIDYIRRSLIEDGGLRRLVEDDGVAGVTSNPTIFEKAIGGSADYDAQVREVLAARPDIDNDTLFEALAIDDIQAACAVLRPVHDRTGGADGYVSFEVPASVANDTAATVAHARRLWASIGRPNLMIKVPATPAGIPAIETLIGEGVNVNVTLMFSLEHYEQVAFAYIRGLERCADPPRVGSVASFFVSRVDSVVDKALEGIGSPEALALRGTTAIANSRLVYQRFLEIFHGEPFAALRARGARVQRPLWASTSTKNPDYRDVIYVEELVAPETVNTVPPATLDAFRDHGRVRGATAADDPAAARAVLDAVERLGIDLRQVTETLQRDGVRSFARSYDDLIAALGEKRGQMEAARVADATAPEPVALPAGSGLEPPVSPPAPSQTLSLGRWQVAVDARLERWQAEDLPRRIWGRDHTVWSPVSVPELADRLGWLRLPDSMRPEIEAIAAFAEEVRAEGVRHVVLLGMGGSSLAPEVFQATFGRREGYPELIVADSTHPGAVGDIERRIDLSRTLFVVSSKSGTTSETASLQRYFFARAEGLGPAGPRFVAITDPGTGLEQQAAAQGFRRVFNGPPDVGGRYSALSAFGLVPAALVGVDIPGVLERARRFALAASADVDARDNPALVLGAAIGELANAGRDKLTFFVGAPFESLPAWLEQLIAESTGKNGQGIVPIADEPRLPTARYGRDRAFVVVGTPGQYDEALLGQLAAAGHPIIRIEARSPLDLGQEFFRWELAVAAAGAVLGIQPFDQPDVQLAKDMARRAMQGGLPPGDLPELHGERSAWPALLQDWLATARVGDYVAILAFLPPGATLARSLHDLRAAVGRRTGLPTTLGFGPRFLHSTGQLHKGRSANGLFLQIVDAPAADLEVPGAGYSFGSLIAAQAAGDAMALRQRGGRVLRVSLSGEGKGGLDELSRAVAGVPTPSLRP